MLAAAFLPLVLSLVGPQERAPEIPTVYPRHVQIVTFEHTGADGATGTYALAERRTAPVATIAPHEDLRREFIDIYRLETGEWLKSVTSEIRVSENERDGDLRPWAMVDGPKGPSLIAIGPPGDPTLRNLTGHQDWAADPMVRVYDAATLDSSDPEDFHFTALFASDGAFHSLRTLGIPVGSVSVCTGGTPPAAAAFVRDDAGLRAVDGRFQFVSLVPSGVVHKLNVELVALPQARRAVDLPESARFDGTAPIHCSGRLRGNSIFAALAQAASGDTPALLALVELTASGESKAHFVGRPTSVDGTALDCGRTLDLVHDIDGDGVPDILTSAPDADPAVPLIAVSGATGAVLATFAGEPGERVGFDLSVSPDGSVVVMLGERPVEGAEPVRTLHVLLVPTLDAPTFRPLGG